MGIFMFYQRKMILAHLTTEYKNFKFKYYLLLPGGIAGYGWVCMEGGAASV